MNISKTPSARYAEFDDGMYAYPAGRCCGRFPLWVLWDGVCARYGLRSGNPKARIVRVAIRCPKCLKMTEYRNTRHGALCDWKNLP